MALAGVSTKDGIFMAGVLVILFIAVAEALGGERDMAGWRKKEDATNAHLFYVIAIPIWLCMVYFLDFRRGLETRVGLPEALTWVLAPVAVVLLIALIASVVTFTTDEDVPWWKWGGLLVIVLAALLGYVAVVAGPSAFLE
jgi:peptidoglycan/LPS O-acetylase OafA/YrhL